MKIERRDHTKKAEIEARALEMLLDLLHREGKSAIFVRWGNDKNEPDVYIKLHGKTIGIEITQTWGELPTAMAKAATLEKQLMDRIKQTVYCKSDWRGCISIHLSRHLKDNSDIDMILKEVEKSTVGIQKVQEVPIRLRQIGSLTMHPWKDHKEKRIIPLVTMSLYSDEDNVPFIKAVEQAVDRKKYHKYGEHENWLLCMDRSTVGLLVEDEEIEAVETRIEELRPENFDKIIVVQSTTEGARGIYSSHEQKE